MSNQPSKFDDDDGRVICSMDVEGMRWHEKRARREERQTRRAASPAGQMTQSEARRYTWYSVLAGLTIVGVFSLTWILFVLFCQFIWFR